MFLANKDFPGFLVSLITISFSVSKIRLVIEESLNQLPFTKCVVTTPTNELYQGLKYQRGNCGVSIVRSGEAMEQVRIRVHYSFECTNLKGYKVFTVQGLRDCCRSIRIGKILVESDADTHEARVVYARFPEDIAQRKVLLMYPIMSKLFDVFKRFDLDRVCKIILWCLQALETL